MTPDEIKALRDRLGWTQRQLADHLNVTVTAVSHWEQGVRTPNRWLSAELQQLENSDAAVTQKS